MLVIKPTDKEFRVFLAGSIEQGNAEEWQDKIVQPFKESNIIFYNPRNDIFVDSKEAERKQIKWELEHLDKADLVAMYLDPNTKSCISLLELGLYVKSNKFIIACPSTFWRYRNVYETCSKYGVRVLSDLNELQIAIDMKYLQNAK